ncbi:MAG: outer membrane beta-barrel protein [Pseudomonadota bacterium]|nr:outer membrane beta-barrel protein [Pseudomonadota bacterium]
MNKKVAGLTFAALVAVAGQPALADAPSYNYVQFDYIVSGDSEIDTGPASESLDLQQGYGIQGAFEIGDYVMVMGRHMSLDYEDEIGFIIGDVVDNSVVNDMTFIGIGGHVAVTDMLSLYGAVGFSRPTFFSIAGEGYGVEVGARANIEMVTASLWYNASNTDTDVGNDTVDIDPEMLGLDVAIEFAPDAPQLVLGYVDATNELDVGTAEADIDYDHFSIGVRKTF